MSKPGGQIRQRLRKLPGLLGNILNFRNAKILLKALREEPPDLIFENFRALLRRGRGQSIYTRKFFQADDHLKVYLLDCRKEAGILKVVIWVLARKGIRTAELYTRDARLPVQPDEFIKPELSALFADFVDFEQKGYLFQVPYKGKFADIHLQLSDQTDHQIKIPPGRFFQFEWKEARSSLDLPERQRDQLVLILHDWNGAKVSDAAELEAQLKKIRDCGLQVLVCTQNTTDPVRPGAFEYLDVQALNHRLKEGSDRSFAYAMLLSLDTLLPDDFFQEVLSFLEENPQTDILYFDEAVQAADGTGHSPTFKPAYSPEYLAADNYIGPNYCISIRRGEALNWFTSMDLRSGAYHFLLRAMGRGAVFDRLPGASLYRREQELVYFTRKEAAEIQARTNYFIKKQVLLNPGLVPGSSEVLRPLDRQPLVSIIIPFKDQQELLKQCMDSVFSKTKYPNIEILLLSNNSREAATFEYLETLTQQYSQVQWFRRDHPFNFSQLNNWAAGRAKGEFLLLLNNDVSIITSGWIQKMLSYLVDERVGAVGTKLLYPDHTVQHAGILTGIGGIAGHAQKHYPDHYGGYNGRINKVQNVSACTAACLMLRKSAYLEVGGMDEKDLPVAFNDVDLCLKIHTAGYRIVYTPFVKLFHFESISRGAEDTPAKRKRAKKEIRYFRKKWRNFIKAGDPYYHPALSKRMGDFEDVRKMD